MHTNEKTIDGVRYSFYLPDDQPTVDRLAFWVSFDDLDAPFVQASDEEVDSFFRSQELKAA